MAIDKKLESLCETAIDTTRGILEIYQKGNELKPQDVSVLRSSSSIITSHVRLIGTRNAETQTHFLLARELAQDVAQLKEYLKLSMPVLIGK